MAGLVTSFTRENCDWPGTRLTRLYWPHSSGLCHMAAWLPDDSFQSAPVAVFVHGGNLGNNPGWGAMLDQLAEAKNLALAKKLNRAGWVIVSIDYPVCGIYRHKKEGGTNGAARILGSWKEIHPLASWPEQPAYVALAVQYLKTNSSAVSGVISGSFSTELWGAGNSIDQNQIWLVGDDWGATMCLHAALQPTGVYKFDKLGAMAMDRYMPRESHRVKGVIARNPGPLDFTQFHVRRQGFVAPTPTYLQNDRFHPLMRAESDRRWSNTPMIAKANCPWWALMQNHIENSQLLIYTEFENNGSTATAGTYDSYLTHAQWNPGTVRNGDGTLNGNGYQWIVPDDGRIQSVPWRSALQEWSYPNAAITSSIVRDNVSGTADPVITDPDSFATEVKAFMEG